MFIIESLIPMPMPWFRLGLANLFSLLALKWWGLREGFFILLIRVSIGHLLVGRFLSPTFMLSLGGGIGAILIMWWALRYTTQFLSLIGVSLAGACIHNWIQLILVQLLLIKQFSIFYFFPFFTISGIITGILTGGMAILIDSKFNPIN